MADVNPAPIDKYLRILADHNGTDLHITALAPPLLRVDGHVRPLNEAAFTADAVENLVREMLPAELWERCVAQKEVDFAFDWAGAYRLRGNVFHTRTSVAMALRLIPYEIPSFEDLRIPATVISWCELHQGLVLVTGPTGSGKSTTLAAMLDSINQRRRAHILTLEDPIEYVHQHKLSMVNQRELGTDCESFARGLRSALREDPDIVLVGEMRDPETIAAVLTIAETGHLVFSTLHTNDAGQSIDRVVDVFSAERQNQIRIQLAGSLVGICSQRLLSRQGGGLVASFEVLVASYAVRNLIREGKSGQLRNQIATGAKFGMSTLEVSLSQLAADGLITWEDAQSYSLYPNELVRPAGMPAVAAT
jgi:twitching motility protein PilT